jgi:diguanylate cyclase (GGDEF)-like protein
LEPGVTIARFGGDEFVVIMPYTRADQCLEILRGLGFPAPSVLGDKVINMSIGVAEFPKDGDTPADLLKMASRRMYASRLEPKTRIAGSPEVGTGHCL